MNDVEHALSEIADIRAQLSESSRFRGFAPQAMTFGALLSLVVAMAQTLWPTELARDAARFVLVWAAALLAASVVGAIAAVSRARLQHGPLAAAMLGATLRQLAPFAAAGAIIAAILLRASGPAAWLVPGLWLILIGLAGFAEAPRLPRAILWPAGWFLASGAFALALAARDSQLSPWVMGAASAIGQGAVAIILERAGGGTHGRT
jgi:hypothetical protein